MRWPLSRKRHDPVMRSLPLRDVVADAHDRLDPAAEVIWRHARDLADAVELLAAVGLIHRGVSQ